MKKKLDRRMFVEKTARGVAVTGLLTATSFYPSEKADMGNLFIHHVFFWLRKPVTEEVRKKFEKALKELVTIETITGYHLGVPAPTNREVIDSSYTYSLLTTYRNKEDQDIYQTHPKHLSFIDDCSDLWEKVVVYDSVSI